MSFENFRQEDSRVAMAMDLKNEKRNKMIIEYSKEVSDFIEGNSAKVDNYYHLPYYFRKVGEGLFEITPFDKLPNNVIEMIKEVYGK